MICRVHYVLMLASKVAAAGYEWCCHYVCSNNNGCVCVWPVSEKWLIHRDDSDKSWVLAEVEGGRSNSAQVLFDIQLHPIVGLLVCTL